MQFKLTSTITKIRANAHIEIICDVILIRADENATILSMNKHDLVRVSNCQSVFIHTSL